ncbi:MAG: protoheme IX farnesyltransferase [Deltaproteobacteria bacterium]|nr:protoheme IX farnesyltransferase [Deltaproteobacteria bacterium]
MNADVVSKPSGESGNFSYKSGIISDLFALTKPTITLLVAVTVIPSLLLATWPASPDFMKSLAAVLGASLVSASAAVFNQLVESDLDIQMDRTKRRSLACGRVSPDIGCFFAVLLGLAGLGTLWLWGHWLSALIGLLGHLFYVVVYTLGLKKRTEQNIVIGGAAGAVGPLIGWAAVTGEIAWPAWVLFLIIFLWTPPHFWALALKYEKDYAKAGIPMYPCIHGDHQTRKMMFFYTLSLIPCVLAIAFYPAVGFLYLILAGVLTAKFCLDAWLLYRSGCNTKTMPFFHFSCFYIFGIFGALALDSLFMNRL